MKQFVHIDKEGNETRLEDLDIMHLLNILSKLEDIAEKGLTVRYGGGSTAEDMYYDEETYYGEEALKRLDYYEYKKELKRRNKIKRSCKQEYT